MSTQLIERMTVEVDGEGVPVVMIHGLGGTSNTFTPQMPLFRNGFRVIRPDLPGSGRSRPPADRLSIGYMVQSVIGLCKVLGVEKAHFVGHSMGTIVCQMIAVERPSLVKSLALFGPISEPPEQARQGLNARAEKVRSEGMAEVADIIVNASMASETRERNLLAVALVREMLMRQLPEGYAANCEALSAAQAAAADLIDCPVLLVTGSEDKVAPASMMRAMQEQFGRARSVILDRCGHWATFEQAEKVNHELKEFIYSVREQGYTGRQHS